VAENRHFRPAYID